MSATLEGSDAISSSRIRAALTEGDIPLANQLLGREYAIVGNVTTGARRGRTIGFPTANLDGVTTMLPKEGVYVGRVNINGQEYATAINIGPNPTFLDQQRKIEAHILDFSGDVYDQELALHFIDRLRDVQTFRSVDELKQQLHQDIAATRTRWNNAHERE